MEIVTLALILLPMCLAGGVLICRMTRPPPCNDCAGSSEQN